MVACGGDSQLVTAGGYWALSSQEKEKVGRGLGLWGGGNLASSGEATSRNRTEENQSLPLSLMVLLTVPAHQEFFFQVFVFFSQSNMAFMQGLVMKRDKKPARVFRALLGGLDPPPAKACSWSGELKPLIRERFGQGQCESAGNGEQMNETERWGFQTGDRDTWSLFYPVSQYKILSGDKILRLPRQCLKISS